MQITPEIYIKDEDIVLEFIRASGPGGQKVNKVATAVRLRVPLAAICGLDAAARARLVVLAGQRLTQEGELFIRAEAQRTQAANRRAALERLAELIRQASVSPKKRRSTKPTRASIERRLMSKSKRAQVKKLRNKPPPEL